MMIPEASRFFPMSFATLLEVQELRAGVRPNAAESKTICGICIVYVAAANRKVTRLKGAIEGHGH
jgi:hypothetical protein